MGNRLVTQIASQNSDLAAIMANMNLNPKNALVEYKSATVVTVKGSNVGFELNGKWWILDTDFDLDLDSDLDTGAKAHGTDYYVYLCDNGGKVPVGLLSAATTYPTGYNANTSRKYAGFHYGRVRLVNANWIPLDAANGAYGAGWEDDVSTAILSNSVWDLKNRPTCSPEGMSKVGNLWEDIYEPSVDDAITLSSGKLLSGTTKSIYNANPLTGTEGLNWYLFNELAKRTGKRMLTYAEWLQGAEGSPQGNDGDNVNAWSHTSNSARNPTGTVANAVSAYNICDCVGNVWEWLNEFLHDPTATTGAWQDPMTGQGVGQLYMYSATGLHAFLAGGFWFNGVIAGSRCVHLYYSPWNVRSDAGCRFACDSL